MNIAKPSFLGDNSWNPELLKYEFTSLGWNFGNPTPTVNMVVNFTLVATSNDGYMDFSMSNGIDYYGVPWMSYPLGENTVIIPCYNQLWSGTFNNWYNHIIIDSIIIDGGGFWTNFKGQTESA
jgi:hypothetical protein